MFAQDAYPRIDEETLKTHTAAIVRHAGASAEDARTTAEVLVASDIRGIESHGVARLEQYIASIHAGVLDPKAQPEIIRQSAATALVDAHNGLGQVTGVYAMSLAIEKAKHADVGIVSLRNGCHYGIAGYYA